MIELPSAAASGIETTSPSGWLATAASISCAISTMSKVAGARYSTVAPVTFCASSTPFLTTDQNGSDAWPCTTTTIRGASCACAAVPIPRASAAVAASVQRPPDHPVLPVEASSALLLRCMICCLLWCIPTTRSGCAVSHSAARRPWRLWGKLTSAAIVVSRAASGARARC